jgi:hypothetical protein
MEYVSKSNKRKDYEESFRKYERELKVPYLLMFYPDNQELTVYRHNGRKYVTVKPNEREHYAVSEVEIEVALLDGWVRYWYQGQLLPLPAELQRGRDEALQRADRAEHHASQAEHRAQDLQRKLEAMEQENARLRAQTEQTRPPRRRNGS